MTTQAGVTPGFAPDLRGRARRFTVDSPVGAPHFRLTLSTLERTWVVLEGIGQKELARGPGHTGAAPGQLGNVVIAGHRNPVFFWDLDELAPGDPIVVRRRDGSLVYRVVSSRVVSPMDGWVMAANPDRAADPPARRLLTLITCHPKLTVAKRLVVRAELTTDG